jgi:hypothetical protein
MQRKPDQNQQLGEFFAAHAGRLERVDELAEHFGVPPEEIAHRRDDLAHELVPPVWLCQRPTAAYPVRRAAAQPSTLTRRKRRARCV